MADPSPSSFVGGLGASSEVQEQAKSHLKDVNELPEAIYSDQCWGVTEATVRFCDAIFL
jgi:hypothetical protein